MWMLLALLLLATPAFAADMKLTPIQTVQVRVTNYVGTPLDWVGLFEVGALDTDWIEWYRLNGNKHAATKGLTTGGATFVIPDNSPPLEIRMFKGTGFGGWMATMPVRLGPTITVEMGSKFTGLTGEPRCLEKSPITVTTDLTCTAVFAP